MTRRKRGAWSAFELERLTVLFPRHHETDVARMLGRSVRSVRRRAQELLAVPRRKGPWTEAEDAKLRLGFGAVEPWALAMMLGRTITEVRKRAAQLRRQRREGPWRPEEDRLLKEIHGTRRDRDLEVCLSRPVAEVRARARKLCLAKDKRFAPRSMPRWTEEELVELRAWYPDHDNLSVARRLGRSVVAVANKASQLGLRKSERFLRAMGERNVSARRDRRACPAPTEGSANARGQRLNSERAS